MRTPDVYQTVERPVVVHPGYREVVRVPAVVMNRTERVEVKPARIYEHVEPAVYGTILRRELQLTMRQAGTTSIKTITPSHVVRA